MDHRRTKDAGLTWDEAGLYLHRVSYLGRNELHLEPRQTTVATVVCYSVAGWQVHGSSGVGSDLRRETASRYELGSQYGPMDGLRMLFPPGAVHSTRWSTPGMTGWESGIFEASEASPLQEYYETLLQ